MVLGLLARVSWIRGVVCVLCNWVGFEGVSTVSWGVAGRASP